MSYGDLDCPVPSFAEQTLHERLAAALAQQDKAAAGRLTKQAVRDAGKLDWGTLYPAAQGAVFVERIADAHFLYQGAQMRARIELAAFPPIDPRGIASLMDDMHLRASAAIDPLMVSHSKDSSMPRNASTNGSRPTPKTTSLTGS